MSTQPLFTVLYVEKSSQHIDVGIKHKDGEETEVQISLSEYENWLKEAGKLECCNDWVEAGEHQQQTWRMTISEYWETAEKYHESDRYDFLISSKIGFSFLMKGIYDSIQSICNDYSPL